MCTCCQNWMSAAGAVAMNGNSYNCGRNNGCYNRCCHSCGCSSQSATNVRYITFPVSGTAVVPVSSICFYPTSWGNGNGNAQSGNTSSNSGCNCCGFGRCGSQAAISNYYQDYYARQYGLND